MNDGKVDFMDWIVGGMLCLHGKQTNNRLGQLRCCSRQEGGRKRHSNRMRTGMDQATCHYSVEPFGGRLEIVETGE